MYYRNKVENDELMNFDFELGHGPSIMDVDIR